jgi:hypothetical protein
MRDPGFVKSNPLVKFNRPPLVVFGAACGVELADFLSKIFLVVRMNEAFTSANCPRCHAKVKKAEQGQVRHWKCSCYPNAHDKEGNVDLDPKMNKDTSACSNILFVFMWYLAHGERNEKFRTTA